MPEHTADAEYTQDQSRQGLQPTDAGDDFDAVWDEISAKSNSSTGEPGVRPDGPDPSPPADPKTDPGPAASPDQSKDEILKKAHGYDSMLGRLEKERQAKKELEERLARYEQQAQSPLNGQQAPPADPGTSQAADRPQGDPVQPAQPAQPATADIPEELQDEVIEFQRKYPDYADLVETDSPQGEQVRALLREYGPDMAAVKADAVTLREQVQAETSQVRSSVEETRQSIAQKEAQEHWGRIGSKYPGLQRLQADPESGQDYQAFLGRLNAWIEEQPLRQARQITAVIQQGTADQVLQVLDAYAGANAQDSVLTGGGHNGEHNGGHKGDHKDRPDGPPGTNFGTGGPGVRPAPGPDADAAAAVPSRPGPPPNPNPTKDDFDAAWEARTRVNTT